MNILHILSSDDIYGSAQCFLELLKRENEIDNVKIVVVTPCFNKINEYCNMNNILNYVVSYKQFQIPKHNSSLVFCLKYLYHMFKYYINRKRAVTEIMKIVDNHNINIIHTNSSVIDIGAEVGKLKSIPHIWHLREFGKEDFNFYSLKFNYIDYMNKTKSYFIAISDAVRNTWIKRGLCRERISTFYDGIDIKRYNLKNKKSEENHFLNIVMVGSFCEAKGQIKLVEAINLLSEFDKKKIRVSFYGKNEGKYYNKLKKIIQKYELQEYIRFEGYSNNIFSELEKFDVGVICSKAEAFGRVTVEYMLAGLCPIVPNSGANIEIVQNNECGIVYDNNNIYSLSNVLHLIINDKKIINKYKSISPNIAMKKYDINSNFIYIYQYFKDILNDNMRKGGNKNN